LRRIFACFAVCALAAAEMPARAPAIPAFGVVTESSDAHVNGVPLSTGSTVYDSETLFTGDTGDAGVLGSASRLYLPGKSAATLHVSADGAFANLNMGTIVFSSAKASAIRIVALNAQIRPSADVPTVAQISVVGPKLLQIFARRGTLLFSYRDESAPIPEGSSFRVVLDPPDDVSQQPAAASTQEPPQIPPHKPVRKRKAFIFLIFGSSALFTVIALHKVFESPDRP
jgi:hypothetical protein